MRLRFSRTADYALRAALEIARVADTELVTRRALADTTNAPTSVVAQVLATLAREDILEAHAGPKGGYRLARPADDVSVYEVVVAIDGEDHEERCVLRESVCSWTGACPFHPVMAQAQERFLDILRTTTLADVLAGDTAATAAHDGA